MLACAVLACRTHSHRAGQRGAFRRRSRCDNPPAAEIERAAREHRMPTDAELERGADSLDTEAQRHGPDRATRHREARPTDPGPASHVRTWRERHRAAPADLCHVGDAQASLSPSSPKRCVQMRCWCCAERRTGPSARRWRRHASSSARNRSPGRSIRRRLLAITLLPHRRSS